MADAVNCAKSGQKLPEGYYNLQLLLPEPIAAEVLEAAGGDESDPVWWEALCRPSRKLRVGQLVCAIGTPGCLDGPKLKDMPPYSAWIGKEDNEKKWIKCRWARNAA